MKSFAILRTNVGLTTNIRVTIDSDYNLSLDSIESNQNLSLDRFKNVKFNKKNHFDELIPYFFKDIPSDIAFEIKYDNDADIMGDDFKDQYDELYQYGARNILNNKNYKEEFEYFAPLYINKGGIPKNFVIFRVDGPGVGLLTKENFTTDVVNKLKCVKLFDLTSKTPIGEWLENNITKNNYFPNTPLEMDFRELEFCRWNGIDYKSGGYTSKSLFIDDVLDEEKEIFELERFIFDNYKKNSCVFANILNLNFLFDDEPSTPDIKRKWSINRYYGFYLDDLELVNSLSPYITPFLKDDVEIVNGNILSSQNGDPFVNGWSDKTPLYVEYLGNYYKVEKFTETLKNQLIGVQGSLSVINSGVPNIVNDQYVDVTVTRFRIISDLDLTGKQDFLNKNFARIDSNNTLIGYDNNPIQIENFEDYSVWLIEIEGIYHNLILDNGFIKLSTDYSFSFNENDFVYKVAGVSTKISTIVDFNNSPKKFSIYKAKFTDIKDFDTRIIDTDYSKFEYEKENELTVTDETKMYLENLNTNTNPKNLDDFRLLINSTSDEVVNIPVSSEYTANYETFKINKNNLSDIWRKNPIWCRWSYQGSISSNDVAYPLNNSLIFEDFNRTVNPFDPEPKRIERNLDYFYTINSSTSSYLHHSLHIEKSDNNVLDTSFVFELDKYLNLATYSIGTQSATYSYDYFTDFFYQKQHFLNGNLIKNVKKYSEFNSGDKSTPNISLFRGLKFKIYDVETVDVNLDGEIQNINLKTSNTYDGYKLSILLSDNNKTVDNGGNIIDSENLMQWSIISEWKMDQDYATNSIVIFNDILYISNQFVNTPEPTRIINYKQIKTSPSNLIEWDNFNPGSIFWSPDNSGYIDNDYVYNSGEYYYYVSSGIDDFWNPDYANSIGYNIGDIVLFKNKYYQSIKNENRFEPNSKTFYFTLNGLSSTKEAYWVATQSSSPKWKPIELWSSIKSYTVQNLVIHNDILWKSNSQTSPSDEPGVSLLWDRKYSLVQDTDFIYKNTLSDNSIIEMNDSIYYCESNNNNSTLDNGIIIYINKKWKNILININISDNTLPNLKSTDRDILYTELYKKVTAFNFTNSINDISNKFGFSDYVSYVIINEDGTITKHNFKNNVKNLPCKMEVDFPDELSVKINSLTKNPIQKPIKLKSSNTLKDGIITDIKNLNHYNELPVSAEIIENQFEPKVFENYSNNKNFIKNQLWRHSGDYMPTFYDIQLFYKGMDDNSDNGKFDTSLTEFALMKERKIRKINRKGSILKLKNELDIKSIYPMLDEFGYTWRDFFIFNSTWDLQYHLETELSQTQVKIVVEDPTLTTSVTSLFGQPSQYISNQNQNL
jgi:hypothetical protein